MADDAIVVEPDDDADAPSGESSGVSVEGEAGIGSAGESVEVDGRAEAQDVAPDDGAERDLAPFMGGVEIRSLIYTVRGVQVMLDSDLAMLYQVETKALNQAVTRNPKRFPERFCFRLTRDEAEEIRSQIVTLHPEQGKRSSW